MTRPVRIGLIGCGSVAVGCYLPLLERLNLRHPAGEVVIACDLNPDRAPHLKKRFGITAFTTDPAEVLGNPAGELVLILTSMRDHGALARAALEAGKHVLVEKPMATSSMRRPLYSLWRRRVPATSSARHMSCSARPIRRSGGGSTAVRSARF